MLDFLMWWEWAETGISYTNRLAMNELVLLRYENEYFLISSSHSTNDILLLHTETRRHSASLWSKTLCLNGVSTWGPSKEQKQSVGRGGLLTNLRSHHLEQAQYLWWSNPPSVACPLTLVQWLWEASSIPVLLGISGECGVTGSHSRVLQPSYSGFCNAPEKEVRGIDGQNEWLGSCLHRYPLEI